MNNRGFLSIFAKNKSLRYLSDNKINRASNCLGNKGLLLLFGEVMAMALVGAFSSTHFSFADSASIVIAFAIAYLVPRFIYSGSKESCRWGQWTLLLAATALAFYAICEFIAWTPVEGFSLEMPYLTDDSEDYYRWALSHYDGRFPSPDIIYTGLPIIMLGLWKIFGVNVVWPMALNIMCILLTMVITGKIAIRLLSHRFPLTNPANIAASAMLMVALLGFFVAQGMRIQKESYCSLGFTMVAYAFVGMSVPTLSKREKRRDLLMFLAGTLIVAFIRTNFVYFIFVGAVMMSLANKCAQWKRGALMAAVALSFTFLFNFLFNYTIEHQLLILEGGKIVANDFELGKTQQPYQNIIGDYYFYPQWKRVLMLPVTMGVQYIIPFPWIYDYSNATIMTIMIHVRFMWYFVGGICLFYYLYLTVARSKKFSLGMWALWPVLIFVFLSFATGGLVSRYFLPIQPMFVVIALYVMLLIKAGHCRRAFTIGMVIYLIVLFATFYFCYYTHVGFLRSNNLINS